MRVLGIMIVTADDDPIPGKNFRALGTKELWEHAADTLLSVDCVTDLHILTDTPKRFEDETAGGAVVYQRSRPGAWASPIPDGIPSVTALAHAAENSDFDAYAVVNPACPFIKQESISLALDHLAKHDDVHKVYSVTRYEGTFETRKRERLNDGAPFYEVNGALAIYRRRALWPVDLIPDDTKDTVWKVNGGPIQGINIRSWPDWEIAQAIQEHREREKNGPDLTKD